MDNNNDLSNVEFELDESEKQIPQETPTQAQDVPIVDFFNSAGNTKLDSDEETTDTDNKEEPNKEKPKGKIVLGKLISGKSAVTLVNIFIPSFIVFALNRFGYDAQKSQLKLSSEEKDILTPVVQDCLDYVEINFDNPFYALAFVATMIYGSKVFDIVPDLKKVKNDLTEDIEEIPTSIKRNDSDGIVDLNDYIKPEQPTNRQYTEVRKKLESTTIRKEKNRIIIEAMETEAPKDLIEAYKIYNGIFPERNENYFRKWHSDNIEIFPDSLKFNDESLL